MKAVVKKILKSIGFSSVEREVRSSLRRLCARLSSKNMLCQYLKHSLLPRKFHFGCGHRKINGWLNCDVKGSDINIDLASGKLPFPPNYFEYVCSQHVIEHLRLIDELQPLLREINRCTKKGGQIWLSCPDLAKICNSYLNDKGEGLLRDRQSRYSNFTTQGYPASFMINNLFHQGGQHKNLFDFVLLEFTLKKAGFKDVKQHEEKDLLLKFHEFPPRNHDYQSLYVSAVK